MHIRLIVVGSKQQQWVTEAFQDYAKRLPRQWNFSLSEIPALKRSKNESVTSVIKKEGAKILSELKNNEQLIILDENGMEFTTQALSDKLENLSAIKNRFCFVIGGPDGLSDECKKRADMSWSLTKLTLPHGLVRVIFIEQIYRVWTLMSQHPYHRI
jgi:23S rRNA (pseudouridine1915-N3)-methyltransferase